MFQSPVLTVLAANALWLIVCSLWAILCFGQAAKDVKDFLTQQRVQQAMPEFFAAMRKDAGVQVLDAKYRVDVAGSVDPTKAE